ncbi:hypothetical protein OUZ56_032291 [Daphnia magna]|uniref:Uncharacterized protein n=1 Tax=Daphnia magna TaxID=35525 RepID=A0ABQ9ZWQ8_9CRUS|nr:hypothetical protein OUZ56_032291 [Daphnia magna]
MVGDVIVAIGHLYKTQQSYSTYPFQSSNIGKYLIPAPIVIQAIDESAENNPIIPKILAPANQLEIDAWHLKDTQTNQCKNHLCMDAKLQERSERKCRHNTLQELTIWNIPITNNSATSSMILNCKWHIGCGLDRGGVWSLGHVGVSLVYTLRTLNVRADLPSSVKPLRIFGIDFECYLRHLYSPVHIFRPY